MVPKQKTALPATTSIPLGHQCVAIVQLAQPLLIVLAAFAYISLIITTQQVILEDQQKMASSLFGEIHAQILGGRIQPAWPWHHVCKFLCCCFFSFSFYTCFQSLVLTTFKKKRLNKRAGEAATYMNGNKANCSFFFTFSFFLSRY